MEGSYRRGELRVSLLRLLGLFSASLPIDYLVVGGGGAGGSAPEGTGGAGGGGGAGGLKQGSMVLYPGQYAITVGRKGSNSPSQLATGSSFGTIASVSGGGRGGDVFQNGSSGASGGGGGNTDSGGSTTGGAGISGEGHNGGAGGYFLGISYGGGGGAGGAGGVSGAKGPGVVSDISGVAVEYCRGGGGGVANTTPGSGGAGSTALPGTDGQPGVVIIRYPGPQRATGGNVTTAGGYTIHTFTSDGTFAL